MLYALREVLIAVEEEGLDARWESGTGGRRPWRSKTTCGGLSRVGLELLPPAGGTASGRSTPSGHPAGVDEAGGAVRPW